MVDIGIYTQTGHIQHLLIAAKLQQLLRKHHCGNLSHVGMAV
jgi:hypothetical protein